MFIERFREGIFTYYNQQIILNFLYSDNISFIFQPISESSYILFYLNELFYLVPGDNIFFSYAQQIFFFNRSFFLGLELDNFIQLFAIVNIIAIKLAFIFSNIFKIKIIQNFYFYGFSYLLFINIMFI